MATCWRLGLTGGIGSGKSTVAALLAGHGAEVVDADAIARAATAPGGIAIAALRAAFGDTIVAPDGGLDRERMRTLAFSEPDARRRLEAIIHPLVRDAAERQAWHALEAGRRWLVHDIPLLAETAHVQRRFDAVLVIDCTPDTQVRRVMERSGLPAETVRGIIAAQASRSRRLALADIVIFNDGISRDALALRADAVAAWARAALADESARL